MSIFNMEYTYNRTYTYIHMKYTKKLYIFYNKINKLLSLSTKSIY